MTKEEIEEIAKKLNSKRKDSVIWQIDKDFLNFCLEKILKTNPNKKNLKKGGRGKF